MKLPPGEIIPVSNVRNPLEAYLSRGNYERLQGIHASYETISVLIASTSPSTIIAVDGPSNGGKTTLTRSLFDFYKAQSIPVALLPLDFFLTDRSNRNHLSSAIAKGDVKIDDYSSLAWEQDRFREAILQTKILSNSPKTQELLIPNTYNRQTGDTSDTQAITIEPGAIIITEGVGIQTYHSDLFDVTVRVDTYNNDIIFERLKARELQKADPRIRLDDDFLKKRLDIVDIPHTHHLRAHAPCADFVVDTSNFDQMVIYRHY